MNTSCGATLRRPLAVLVAAIGLTVGACANHTSNNTSNVAGPASTTSSAPVMTSAAPAPAQPTINSWAKSMCQALGFAFLQLGSPPEPDFTNPAATRQAFGTYLSNAANATQRAIDLLSSVGAPPVDNGQRILDQMRTQLTQLRGNLNEMATQLNRASPNDVGAIGQAFGAIGNVVGLFGTLTNDPQLRAAIDQTPECHTSPG
ncbi:MAG TPA: hypothetical protein VJS67_15920 [Pseudonocardiaceae bacterium]|jgi:type IV pilus biogenesis protein CpaD/CtpE|nr:hypothetical protein [Pseudonocardiaceae bacterium]